MYEIISNKNVGEIVSSLRSKGYQLDMIPSEISNGSRSSFAAVMHSSRGGMLGSRNEPGVKVAIYDLGNSRRVELEALSVSPMGQKFNLKKGEQLCDQLYSELNEVRMVAEPKKEDDFAAKFMKGFKEINPSVPSEPAVPEPTPEIAAVAAPAFTEKPKPDYIKQSVSTDEYSASPAGASTWRCEKCGKINLADSNYCGDCGTPKPNKGASGAGNMPTPKPPKPPVNKAVIIIAAVTILVLAVGIPIISKLTSAPSYDDEYYSEDYDDSSPDESGDDSFDDESYDNESSIPDGAEEYDGHYYMVIDNPSYWSTAKEDCESRGGHLATITSQDEQDFVASLIGYSGSQYNYWIGGTDEGQEGTWTWITGEPWSYSNWYKNQPDNGDINKEKGGEGDHNYLQIGCGSDEEIRYMKWWDMSDSGVSSNFTEYPNYKDTQYFGYICEWE